MAFFLKGKSNLETRVHPNYAFDFKMLSDGDNFVQVNR